MNDLEDDEDEGPTFTVEISDYIPRGVHITIFAADYAAAMAEANRLMDEGEIDWEGQETWDDGCTESRITGLWEGDTAYGGPDLRTPADIAAYERALVDELTSTVTMLETVRKAVKAYDDDLNRREVVPTADDYNALFALIMEDPK